MRKYLEYKEKYKFLSLKGGSCEIDVERTEFLNKYNTDIIDIPKYIEKRNNDFIDYISSKRDEGFKIMLIVGATPEQQDKFNIIYGYLPIYLEKDYMFGYYPNSLEILDRLITEPFESYPLLVCDLFKLEERFPEIKYDLIIFDGGVCFHLGLNVEKILGLFRLTYDNNSIIIFDNISNIILDEKLTFEEIESENLPLVYRYRKNSIVILESQEISSFYKLWFEKYFDKTKLLFNDQAFFVVKNHFQSVIRYNPTKTIIIYTEINPYLKNNSQYPYLYCCQTKNYLYRN